MFQLFYQQARTLTASGATLTLAGSAMDLTAQRALVAATTTYGLTGSAAALTRTFSLTASPATYALAGNAATLTEASGPPPVASTGEFTLSGADAEFPRTYSLTPESGAFTLSGGETGAPVEPIPLPSGGGSYVRPFSYRPPTLRHFAFTARPATFTASGAGAELRRSSVMTTEAHSFSLSSGVLGTRRSYSVKGLHASFTATGSVGARRTRLIETVEVEGYSLRIFDDLSLSIVVTDGSPVDVVVYG